MTSGFICQPLSGSNAFPPRIKATASWALNSATEDIASSEPDKYDYKYLREDTHNGIAVWVVERYPKDPNSGYTKIITWVDQSNYQAVKNEYFDRKSVRLKIQYDNGNMLYLGRFWKSKRFITENLQTKKKTILKFDDWRFQEAVKESFFTKRSLERQR